ncbi:MyoD light chain [Balamuthia mandrillaris]
MSLDEETIAELTEAFQKHDKDKDGRLNVPELGAAMRYMGLLPSFAELEDMVRKHGGGAGLDQTAFQNMLASDFQENDNEKELIDAFQVFDKDGKGFLPIMELRHVLMNMGEKQTDQDVAEILQENNISGDGNLDYASFVRAKLAMERQ